MTGPVNPDAVQIALNRQRLDALEKAIADLQGKIDSVNARLLAVFSGLVVSVVMLAINLVVSKGK